MNKKALWLFGGGVILMLIGNLIRMLHYEGVFIYLLIPIYGAAIILFAFSIVYIILLLRRKDKGS